MQIYRQVVFTLQGQYQQSPPLAFLWPKSPIYLFEHGLKNCCMSVKLHHLTKLGIIQNVPLTCRQLHPKLLEGLDAALSALEPKRLADLQGSSEQMYLKAFRNGGGTHRLPRCNVLLHQSPISRCEVLLTTR